MVNNKEDYDFEGEAQYSKLTESKGQLISEWLFDFLNFPKNQGKIWWISTLESIQWSNQKDKGTTLC